MTLAKGPAWIEEEVRDLLRRELERLLDKRFGYRFAAEVERAGKQIYELEVSKGVGAEQFRICSAEVWTSLAAEPDLILKMRLELWPS